MRNNPIYIRTIKHNIILVVLNYMAPPLYIKDIEIESLRAVWSRYELLLKMLLESSSEKQIVEEIKDYDDFLSEKIPFNIWSNQFDHNKVNDLIENVYDMVKAEQDKHSLLSKIKFKLSGVLMKPFMKDAVLTKSIVPDYSYFNNAYNICQKYNLHGLSIGLSDPYKEVYFSDIDFLLSLFEVSSGYNKEQIGLNGSLNLRFNNTVDFNMRENNYSEYQSLGYFIANKDSKDVTGDLTLMIYALNEKEKLLEVLLHEHTHALDYYIGKEVAGVNEDKNLFSSYNIDYINKFSKIKDCYRTILFSTYNFGATSVPTENESHALYQINISHLIENMFAPYYVGDTYGLQELKYHSEMIFGEIRDRVLARVDDANSYKNLRVLFNHPLKLIDEIVIRYLNEIKIILFSSDMKMNCFYYHPSNHAENGFDSSVQHYNYYLSIEERFANAAALGVINDIKPVKESLKKLWKEINKIP